MRARLVLPVLVQGACSSATPPSVRVESAVEIGTLGQSSLIVGRDGGWGAHVSAGEVFVFGDSFVSKADADGSSFHSNSYSFTTDRDAADGIGGLVEPVDALGSPLPLVPPTDDEAIYNDAHRGTDGARWAMWAGRPSTIRRASGRSSRTG